MTDKINFQHWDNQYYFHPWQDLATEKTERTNIVRSDGVYIFDDRGNRLLDGPAGMWSVQIGHNRQRMADAIADQVMKISHYNPFANTSTPAILLAEKLASLAPIQDCKVFFTTCGSTANDTALRFVQFYNNVRGRPNKKKILSRHFAYHGSSYLSASVSGKERDKSHFDLAHNIVHLLPHVNPYRRKAGQTEQEFCDEKINELEQAILELGADNIAAFIAEPIQASGGLFCRLRVIWRAPVHCVHSMILFISATRL